MPASCVEGRLSLDMLIIWGSTVDVTRVILLTNGQNLLFRWLFCYRSKPVEYLIKTGGLLQQLLGALVS